MGPYEGGLGDHTERIRLSYPLKQTDPKTGKPAEYMVTVDEVTYCDGGRWPDWADGMGASLELRDPRSDNDTPDAWADSDESGKTQWKQFSFTIDASDSQYTHDNPAIFDFMLLNAGEMLIDDLELVIGGSNRLTNGGFEAGESPWRILGNHTRSFVTTADHQSGSRALHLIATGHGDPGANRINQSINGSSGTVTFRGWARWLRGQPIPAASDHPANVSRAAAPTGACLRDRNAAESGHAGPAEHRVRRQSRPGYPRRAARADPARRRASRSS